MGRIIVFAGTSEGRELAQRLAGAGREPLVCVATEYGEEMLSGLPSGRIRTGRMDQAQMEALLREEAAEAVVDATHPYAAEVSRNLREACALAGIRYVRLQRPRSRELSGSPDLIRVGSIREAAEILAGQGGRALITTGSKELAPFAEIPGYRERLTVRVLPSAESILACRAAGFEGKNIIAMQGPFSEEMNTLQLRETGAGWLVTKESGKRGGLPEKLAAARNAGAKVILVQRPEEDGFSAEKPEKTGKQERTEKPEKTEETEKPKTTEKTETVEEIEEVLRILCTGQPPEGWSPVKEAEAAEEEKEKEKAEAAPAKGRAAGRRILLVGVGPGDPGCMTRQAAEAIEQADVLIGSSRLLKGFSAMEKPTLVSYQGGEIRAFLDTHPEYRKAAILLSGDVGFYSGARRYLDALPEEEAGLVCGISSVQTFCARCRIPWEDVCLASVHGRSQNLSAAIRSHRRVFVLTGGRDSAAGTAACLTELGYGDLSVRVGVNLTYPDERIYTSTIRELARNAPEGLIVLLIENPDAGSATVTHGIPDGEFLREKVPMTKEEVRSVILSKMRLTRDSVIADIGAGTGSVAVEAAIQAEKGQVYAIEKKAAAAALIRKNAEHFGLMNLEVICGEAPETLDRLPSLTHAFIGGSGGRMEEICRKLWERNPGIRIVASAVSLEGMAALTGILRKYRPGQSDLVQLSVARASRMGDYHMMTGQNPVMIASF